MRLFPPPSSFALIFCPCVNHSLGVKTSGAGLSAMRAAVELACSAGVEITIAETFSAFFRKASPEPPNEGETWLLAALGSFVGFSDGFITIIPEARIHFGILSMP
jgi:hypothetical protein